MPLPPALAAKLAKRGLLKDASVAGYDPALGRATQPQPVKGRTILGSSGGGGTEGSHPMAMRVATSTRRRRCSLRVTTTTQARGSGSEVVGWAET